jgi:PAS domain S-box-containing protein
MLQSPELEGGAVYSRADSSTDELSLYREIFDRSTDGIAIIDPRGFYVHQNAAHAALTGYTIDELWGRTPAVHIGEARFAELMQALNTTGRFAGEVVSWSKSGDERVLDVSSFAVRNAAGQVTCYIGLKRDVTSRRRSEARIQRHFRQLESLYRMTAAVSRAVPLERILEEALDCLQTALGAQRTSVLLFDPDGIMRFKAARGLSEAYKRAVEGHTPWKRDTPNAQPFGINDVEQEMEAGDLRAAILAEGIRALAFIPLVRSGEVLGKFMLYYDQPHRFEEEELRLAVTIATQIALAITRNRAEEALRAREREYKTLAENIPEVIARLDADGRYLFINPAIQATIGLPPADIIGRTIDEISNAPEVASLWRKRLTSAFAAKRPVQFEFTYPTPVGIRNYTTQLVPELDHDGAVVSVISVTNDITARVQAEEHQRFLAEVSTRLVESLDYDSTLLNLAHLMIETIADGCAIDQITTHGTLQRTCVVTKDPLKTKLVDEMNARFPTSFDSPHGRVIALRTGQPQLFAHVTDETLRALAVSDEHLALLRQIDMQSCMYLPLKARGRTLGVLTLVSHDPARHYDERDLAFSEEVAQRAALVIDNARLYQEAHDASMAKSAFLATMSHELRTPLNAILGYAELMELGVAGSITEQQSQQLERIRASAWHLLTVIEEILTFSRVEAAREEVRLETVIIRDIVDEACSMIEPAVTRKGLELTVNAPDHEIAVRTDRGKVRQILLNLLSNAVKFTPSGRITCSAEPFSGGIYLVVQDTGPGIPPEQCERVFEPFWQATQGATRKAGGTGLGLTVSRQLAQLLGGDVALESKVGVGSTFTVTLPADQRVELERGTVAKVSLKD